MSEASRYRRPWQPEEDVILLHAVEKQGPANWRVLAHSVPGRTGKQCRERWMNHLRPDILKTPFTPEEDAKVMELYQVLGPRWSEISRHMPGRTDFAIGSRFHQSLRFRLPGTSQPQRIINNLSDQAKKSVASSQNESSSFISGARYKPQAGVTTLFPPSAAGMSRSLTTVPMSNTSHAHLYQQRFPLIMANKLRTASTFGSALGTLFDSTKPINGCAPRSHQLPDCNASRASSNTTATLTRFNADNAETATHVSDSPVSNHLSLAESKVPALQLKTSADRSILRLGDLAEAAAVSLDGLRSPTEALHARRDDIGDANGPLPSIQLFFPMLHVGV